MLLNHFAAKEAVPFLIHRVPLPELIESLQDLQLSPSDNLIGETSAMAKACCFYQLSHNQADG